MKSVQDFEKIALAQMNVNPAKSLQDKFIKLIKRKPINSDDTKNFIFCDWCELTVPRYCYIYLIDEDKDEDEEIDDVDCFHCLFKKALVNSKYEKLVKDNMKQIQQSMERLEVSNKTFLCNISIDNKELRFKKTWKDEQEEESDDGGELPCGCIDICRGVCMSFHARKHWAAQNRI